MILPLQLTRKIRTLFHDTMAKMHKEQPDLPPFEFPDFVRGWDENDRFIRRLFEFLVKETAARHGKRRAMQQERERQQQARQLETTDSLNTTRIDSEIVIEEPANRDIPSLATALPTNILHSIQLGESNSEWPSAEERQSAALLGNLPRPGGAARLQPIPTTTRTFQRSTPTALSAPQPAPSRVLGRRVIPFSRRDWSEAFLSGIASGDANTPALRSNRQEIPVSRRRIESPASVSASLNNLFSQIFDAGSSLAPTSAPTSMEQMLEDAMMEEASRSLEGGGPRSIRIAIHPISSTSPTRGSAPLPMLMRNLESVSDSGPFRMLFTSGNGVSGDSAGDVGRSGPARIIRRFQLTRRTGDLNSAATTRRVSAPRSSSGSNGERGNPQPGGGNGRLPPANRPGPSAS